MFRRSGRQAQGDGYPEGGRRREDADPQGRVARSRFSIPKETSSTRTTTTRETSGPTTVPLACH